MNPIDKKLLDAYRKLRSTKTEKTKREMLVLIDKLLDQRLQSIK
jgi:hypothetical protein